MLLNETQAIRDFKQGQHYANGEIRELDECVAKFRQLQNSIQVHTHAHTFISRGLN